MVSCFFFISVSLFFRRQSECESWNVVCTSVRVPLGVSVCWSTHYSQFKASPENDIFINTCTSFGLVRFLWPHVCFFLYFRESRLMSSDPSSSFSTIWRILPSPCRCTILLLAPLDKVKGEQRQSSATVSTDCDTWCVFPSNYAQQEDKVFKIVFRCLLPDEFARAVYVATGLKLTRHLVHTIFKIFDVDHDDQLSYKEFIGIMKDRLHRGARVRKIERFILTDRKSKLSFELFKLDKTTGKKQRVDVSQ